MTSKHKNTYTHLANNKLSSWLYIGRLINQCPKTAGDIIIVNLVLATDFFIFSFENVWGLWKLVGRRLFELILLQWRKNFILVKQDLDCIGNFQDTWVMQLY